MTEKKRNLSEHDSGHVTPAGRSALSDLASDTDAVELEMRSTLLHGLQRWLTRSKLTQTEREKLLSIAPDRVSDLKRGRISRFRLGTLIRLATRAGLDPRLMITAGDERWRS
jgi:predicted XRE-type DNA-binding protein